MLFAVDGEPEGLVRHGHEALVPTLISQLRCGQATRYPNHLLWNCITNTLEFISNFRHATHV